MSNKIKRSDKYDFFKGTINNQKKQKTPKEKFKFGFKFVKIAFYLFLLSLSLTGCIQSIAIKSSSTTGSGIEFYRNVNDIAPFVNSYKIVEFKDKDGKVVSQELILDKKNNYLVTNSTSNPTIEELKTQINKYGENLYGQYNNYSSSLRIVNQSNKLLENTLDIKSESNGQLIKGTDNKSNFLFLNSSMLNKMNNSNDSYKNVNQLMDIPVFINPKFEAYHPITETEPQKKVEQDKTGNYLDRDGRPYDYNDEDDKKEIDSFMYKFNFEKAVLLKDSTTDSNSQKFARDYVQSLVNVFMQFNQYSALNKLPNTTSSEPPADTSQLTQYRLEQLNSIKSNKLTDEPNSTSNFSLNKNSNYLKEEDASYTLKMKISIQNYLMTVLPIISKAGYSMPAKPKVGPPTFEFNNKNFISGGSIIGQKPIVTWGDAWGLGPFYGFVVYPISYVVNSLVGSLPISMGGGVALLSIVISVIAARMLALLLTYKSVFAQVKQQELAPKKAKIDAKYAAYKGNKQMEQKKRQELSALYKKNNINMLTPLLSSLVSMPIFLSMWRIIQGIPFIKSTSIWGINFSQTSWRELFDGHWQYLALIVLAVVIQAGSQFLPKYLNKKRMKERSNVAEKEAMKKANRTQNIIMVIFIFMAVIFQAGVQIYWIVGGVWTMCQTLLIHHIQKTKFFKEKLIKYV